MVTPFLVHHARDTPFREEVERTSNGWEKSARLTLPTGARAADKEPEIKPVTSYSKRQTRRRGPTPRDRGGKTTMRGSRFPISSRALKDDPTPTTKSTPGRSKLNGQRPKRRVQRREADFAENSFARKRS